MVGGYSFSRSKFNRATQAFRQMGSTVKPILYTAAIDRGLTPTTILIDEPTTFDAGVGSRRTRRATMTASSWGR
jgi:penicillin-binding protein 1A